MTPPKHPLAPPYGPFVHLYTGRRYWLTMPAYSDPVDILDIAVPLAKIQRFGGHAPGLYSVAEHSVAVSRLVRPELALAALLHDAGEALLGVDMPSPVKRLCRDFAALEAQAVGHVMRSFGLDAALLHDAEIAAADVAMLIRERDALFDPLLIDAEEWPTPAFGWLDRARAMPLHGWDATRACEGFLGRFHEINNGGL